MTESKKSQNATKNSRKKYRGRATSSQRDTRAITKLIKGLKPTYLSNLSLGTVSPIYLPTFKTVFFNDKHPLEYSREHHLKKLMVCQFIMQSDQTETIKAIPFVLRFNKKDQQLEQDKLKRKIRNSFKKALGKIPLYWINFEHNIKGVRNKHCNGEILIDVKLLSKLRNALKRLYGLDNIALNHAIRFPTKARAEQSNKHGSFYAVYNWCGYSTKENTRIHFEQRYMNRGEVEKMYSISSELNSRAKLFHHEMLFK